MLSNEIKRLKMKKIKFENLEKKILKLDTYRRITPRLQPVLDCDRYLSEKFTHYFDLVAMAMLLAL